MSKENRIGLFFSVVAIILIAGNLRSPITSVSPILSEIKIALHLDNFQASLLTSIPLIVFAGFSILVSKATAKVNIRYGLIYSLLILIFGLFFRVYGNVTALYLGSFLVGLGICIGNVLAPAYIKNTFPHKIGIMTGVFSVSMNLIAALASGFSIAIGKWTDFGWQGSLGIWIIWAFVALVIVAADVLTNKRYSEKKVIGRSAINFNVFRSKQAWNISVFMGIQSLVYYCLAALLPTVLVDFGMDKTQAGWVLSIIQLAMLPVMFISPIIATKMKNQKIMIYGTGILMFIAIGMLSLLKTQYIYLTAILLGTSIGTAFTLSILFFSLRSKTMTGTIKISGKAQSVGYLIAAFGPPIFGKLHDWDLSWKYSFYFLMLSIVVMTFFGSKAAEPRFVEEH